MKKRRVSLVSLAVLLAVVVGLGAGLGSKSGNKSASSATNAVTLEDCLEEEKAPTQQDGNDSLVQKDLHGSSSSSAASKIDMLNAPSSKSRVCTY